MTHHEQLGLALLASVLVHGALLSKIHLRGATVVEEQSRALFIELGAAPSTSTLLSSPEVIQKSTPVESRRPARQKNNLAKSPKKTAHKPPALSTALPVLPSPSNGAPAPDDLRSRSLQMARRDTLEPFAGKRVRTLSPQTRDSMFGPYEESYRQKVEQVGTVNYPPPVNGHPLYGTVRVTATIRQDGSLALIEVRQSSGSQNLDDAARRIVQMAAPFQPFTEAMRAQADLVSITRSFNFVRAGEAIRSQ